MQLPGCESASKTVTASLPLVFLTFFSLLFYHNKSQNVSTLRNQVLGLNPLVPSGLFLGIWRVFLLHALIQVESKERSSN